MSPRDVPLLDQVRVVENVPAEHGASHHRVRELERVVVREEELHKPCADEQHQPVVERGVQRRKVVPRLERKDWVSRATYVSVRRRGTS